MIKYIITFFFILIVLITKSQQIQSFKDSIWFPNLYPQSFYAKYEVPFCILNNIIYFSTTSGLGIYDIKAKKVNVKYLGERNENANIWSIQPDSLNIHFSTCKSICKYNPITNIIFDSIKGMQVCEQSNEFKKNIDKFMTDSNFVHSNIYNFFQIDKTYYFCKENLERIFSFDSEKGVITALDSLFVFPFESIVPKSIFGVIDRRKNVYGKFTNFFKNFKYDTLVERYIFKDKYYLQVKLTQLLFFRNDQKLLGQIDNIRFYKRLICEENNIALLATNYGFEMLNIKTLKFVKTFNYVEHWAGFFYKSFYANGFIYFIPDVGEIGWTTRMIYPAFSINLSNNKLTEYQTNIKAEKIGLYKDYFAVVGLNKLDKIDTQMAYLKDGKWVISSDYDNFIEKQFIQKKVNVKENGLWIYLK